MAHPREFSRRDPAGNVGGLLNIFASEHAREMIAKRWATARLELTRGAVTPAARVLVHEELASGRAGGVRRSGRCAGAWPSPRRRRRAAATRRRRPHGRGWIGA